MSERIHGRVPKELFKIFEAEMKRKGLGMGALLKEIIEAHYSKKVRCPALSEREKNWICVWGRVGKPPQIKNLAELESEKNLICLACTKTIELLERVSLAEQELKKPIKVEYYTCARGGQGRKENTEFYCPRNGSWMQVKYCVQSKCTSLKKTSFSMSRSKDLEDKENR